MARVGFSRKSLISRTGFAALAAVAVALSFVPKGASAQSSFSAGSLLGLPPADRRPPQSAFVLPNTHPVVGSEAPARQRSWINLSGMPGLIDMPAATPLPDGEFTLTVSSFAQISRGTLTFQIAPRLTGAFRYNRFGDINFQGFFDYYDRAFDLQYQLVDERQFVPAIAIGLRDFVGTGIEAAEYIVATKNFELPGRGTIRVTGGLGWGRFGTFGDVGSPFSETRPTFDINDSQGGEVAFDQWFRGPMAPFGGIEWQPNDRWRVKVEYSSDDYPVEAEQQGMFERNSPFNFGVEYQWRDRTRVGVYSLYGTEIGFMANFAFNPRRAGGSLSLGAPGPVTVRPSRAASPELWTTAWVTLPDVENQLAPGLRTFLDPQNIDVLALSFPSSSEAILKIENNGYSESALAVGRTARAMAAALPPSVETFRIILTDGGLTQSAVTIRRSDLEALDATPNKEETLAAVTTVAPAHDLPNAAPLDGIYPRYDFALRPFINASLFDPDSPVRADIGVAAIGSVEIAPGFTIEGELRQRLGGNVGEAEPKPTSLPPVRTDAELYAQADGVTIESLTASYVGTFSPNLYGRITAGYLEKMFGGVSAEVLWKPVTSRIAFGAEVNYAQQRDFDQRFGFQDYDVITGHVLAYYDFGQGFHAQLDVGQYLAGDVGATITLDREFANGWRVGAFATQTDVSAEEFGEGSFDKGIRFTVPLQTVSGRPNTRLVETVIRPIQRDGGAKLIVPGRLYERVRAGHSEALFDDWSRVWR